MPLPACVAVVAFSRIADCEESSSARRTPAIIPGRQLRGPRTALTEKLAVDVERVRGRLDHAIEALGVGVQKRDHRAPQ